ncbi:MAG: gamma-glutamyl-phosphate reductase, partial [Planctomycetia bacterium]|nr:gamma-glutamyl-phosphate reductase [Planctomycetia bacterium]
MAIAQQPDLKQYCLDVARRAHAASVALAGVRGELKNEWLRQSAARLRSRVADVLTANLRDVQAAPSFGLSDAATDRLRL